LHQNANKKLSKILYLGIPAAAAIGGMGTIIGSAPNAIAVGALETSGIVISFIDWMIIGVPVALLLIFLFWLILLKKYGIANESLSLDFLKKKQPAVLSKEEKVQKNVVLSILTFTVLLWLSSEWTGIPVAVVSGIPIVGLTMLGIIDADEVRTLPWDTLMLVAGGLSLGLAIQEQGLVVYFIDQLNNVEINI